MSVREYIGARYVPVFADPIQWDPTNVYEPLTVVTNQGASYVSRKMVPEGIQLTNTDYWVLWADFNAQLQHYIDEVEAFDTRLDAVEETVNDISTEDIPDIQSDIETANGNITVLQNRVSALEPNTEMVIIGDSFSKVGNNLTTQDYWWYKLTQRIGMTPHNYSVSGCGFIRGTETFAEQMTDAIADTSFDNADVGLVVIFGGVNDCYVSATGTDYKNAIRSTLDAAKLAFPNAQIILAGVTTFITRFSHVGWTINNLTIANKTSTLEEYWESVALEYPDICYIPFSRLMLGVSGYFQTSNMHPSAVGQTAIANIFYNVLCGNNPQFSMHRSTPGVDPVFGSAGKVVYSFNSYDFTWYSSGITPSENSGAYKAIFPIPYGLDDLLPGGLRALENQPIGICGVNNIDRSQISYALRLANKPDYAANPPSDLYTQAYLLTTSPTYNQSLAYRGTGF